MAERAGATVAETPASHAVYDSQPDGVIDAIEKAHAPVRLRLATSPVQPR